MSGERESHSQTVLSFSSDCFAVAGECCGAWRVAHVAELSSFGAVACQPGKGPGENYRASPRLSPLADD